MPFLSKSKVQNISAMFDHQERENALWGRDEYISGSLISQNAERRPVLGSTGRHLCANIECTGRKVPWRNRRRPMFEAQWGCSVRCLQSIVRNAVRRERGDGSVRAEELTLHRHRIPLGLLMLDQGWITHPQLRRALEAQKSSGAGRIGEWLVQECEVSPAQVTRGLAIQWNCPVLPLEGFSPSDMALALPRMFVEDFGLLPLRVAGARIVYLAFKERLDAASAFAIEQMSGLKVESGLLDDLQFDAARARLLNSEFAETKIALVGNQDDLTVKISAALEQAQPVGAKLVRLHQHYWLRMWLESGAYGGSGTLPGSAEDVSDIVFTLGYRA